MLIRNPRLIFLAACVLVSVLNLSWSLPAQPEGSPQAQRITNSLGLEFVLIPAGRFTMGSSQEDLQRMKRDFKRATGKDFLDKWSLHLADESPPHEVEITRSFYLQVHEVTNDQFAAFVEATGHRTTAEIKGGGWTYQQDGWRPFPGADWRHPLGPGSSIEGKGRHPVVQVSWDDASAFCQWLSRHESKACHLPSEAQWEYACRGGQTGVIYSWGNEMPPQRLVSNMPDEACAREVGSNHHHVAGYDDGHAGTAPVGSYLANGFELHDMIGNVWEWCADWYDQGYYARSPLRDPQGPSSGTHRVLRGGSFCYLPSNQRCADRFRNLQAFRCHFAGFRVAMSSPTSP